MTDAIMDVLHQMMTSPWVYAAIFLVCLLDAFFPAVPSETAVITAGVFAATGQPSLLGVIVVATVGAFAGDHISYLIGRTGGARLLSRIRPGTARHRAFAWAERTIAERGAAILVVARYIPGGRTATTITMGAFAFPLRSFSAYDALAAVSWAVYSALIGFVGGMAFEHDPFKGLLLGLGFALSVTAVMELVRHLRRRRRAVTPPAPEAELVADRG